MEGIRYVTDDQNRRVAVQIDLEKYGEIWEDIEDILIAEARKHEENISWEDVKKQLRQEGKL
jgi:hypothetical protein